MAHGTYRSAAFWENEWNRLMGQYYGGLGAGVAGISKGLWEQQLPMFEQMISDYYGGAAGLGQIVPGAGGSTASQQGLQGLMADYMADITQTALGAYQMPWQAKLGGAPTSSQWFQQAHAEHTGRAQAFTSGLQGECCFIFIEGNNGVLDRIARRYRDEYGTDKQKIGYKRLASWLVPLMREYKIIKELVKWTMIKPMIAWGKAFYGENRWGHVFQPVAKGWLKAFEIYGRS